MSFASSVSNPILPHSSSSAASMKADPSQPMSSFWCDSLPRIARKKHMSIKHAKRTMEFLDRLFDHKNSNVTKTISITKDRNRKNEEPKEKRNNTVEQRKGGGIKKECFQQREENSNKDIAKNINNSKNIFINENVRKTYSRSHNKREYRKNDTQVENIKLKQIANEEKILEQDKKSKDCQSLDKEVPCKKKIEKGSTKKENFLNKTKQVDKNILTEKQMKNKPKTKKYDETLQDKREKQEFIKFLQFLGLEHKKKKGKKVTDIESVECSIPLSDFEQLFSEKEDKEQLAWKQLKTVQYKRDINYFGSKTSVSWQVEKNIKFKDQFGKKNDNDSNKINFIPQEELIASDKKNQALQKLTAHIEEKNKLYSQRPKIGKKRDQEILDKNGQLPDQHIVKNQKRNWLLDIDPWLAEEEPWKTMEAKGQCFSLKLVPDNFLNITDTSKAEKNIITGHKKSEDRIVNKIGRMKFMLQAYLTTQEENLFKELKEEIEKNSNELNKNILLSGEIRDFEKKCCKVFKKNHKCKRLPIKYKQEGAKTIKTLPPVVEREVTPTRENLSLELYVKLFEECNRLDSKKYSEENKVLHPLFKSNTVVAKQFLMRKSTRFSPCHQETVHEITKNVPNSQYNTYFKLNRAYKPMMCTSQPCPITIFPFQKGTVQNDELNATSTLNKDNLSEFQWIVKEEEENDNEEEDEHDFNFNIDSSK